MKKLFAFFAVFVVFLVAALGLLIMMPPTGLVRGAMVKAARDAGVELKAGGPLKLRVVPDFNLQMEDVTVSREGKTIAQAKTVEVRSGTLAFLRGSHRIEHVVLNGLTADLEIGKDGRPIFGSAVASRGPARSGSLTDINSYSVGTLEMPGANVGYRDQRSGLSARVTNGQITLREATLDKFGEALIKAPSATVSDPTIGTLEVAGLDATAKDLAGSRVRELTAGGDTVRWRDAKQQSAVDAAKLTAKVQGLGLDGSGPLTIESGSLAWRDPATGPVEVAGLSATAKALKGGRLDEVTFKGSKLDHSGGAVGRVSAANVSGTAKTVGADRVDGVRFNSSALALAQGPLGTLNASNVVASAGGATAKGLSDVSFQGATVENEQPGLGKLNATNLTATVKSVAPGRVDEIAFKGGTIALAQAGGTTTGNDVSGTVKSVTGAGRIEGIDTTSARLAYAATTRSGSAATTPLALEQVSFAAPVLAAGAPVDATVGVVWNKEKVAGNVRLPSPEALTAGPAVPANFVLKSSRGDIDFNGTVAADGTAKGKARAATGSLEQLAGWLGLQLPPTAKGPANLTGDVDVQGTRLALSNGQIEHGSNRMSGTFQLDTGGARPKLSGKINADKLDANVYLGTPPVPPKPVAQPQQPRPQHQQQPRPQSKPQIVEPEVNLGDVFRAQVRAMLATPTTRSGPLTLPDLTPDQIIPAERRAKPQPDGFKWSEERFDLSALRAVDLDVDWSVKQLDVRGLQLNVPQLKTHLDNGNLTLEGRDIGTKDGKISGRAQLDAREAVPSVSANLKGDNVDLYALSQALGIPPMIDGDTAVEANVRSRGNSQRQLVEQLSGKVTTNMPQGHVLGYDLGAINLFTFIGWASGNREFDPERRTPISGLKADLDIDKGVVKESAVQVGGPLLGVNAEGTMNLVEQRLDYRGRARISTWFSGIPFKVFGDWSRPSTQVDFGDVFSRSRGGPGEVNVEQFIAAASIKPDPELALMIGRVLQRTGPTGVDANTRALLLAVQKKALGN